MFTFFILKFCVNYSYVCFLNMDLIIFRFFINMIFFMKLYSKK